MIYIGQTRSRKLIIRLSEMGFGECTNRGELPPRRRPWFADNGAFKDWRSNAEFDAQKYTADLARYEELDPAFIVAPDVVAGGMASAAFSLQWVKRMREACTALIYLVVQNGMNHQRTARIAKHFDGIFVGGTLSWKIRSGEGWVRFAHERGLPCHIGRVGTPNRVRWARRIGADSIDSCLPLWSEDNLQRFLSAVFCRQAEMTYNQ